MPELSEKTILITGGSGFLGRHVIENLRQRGCSKLFYPRSKEFDLRKADQIRRLLAHVKPQVVIHLAAVVGGIGANRQHPGQFLYDNAIMGIQLIEESRLFGVEKLVTIGTVCAYPKFCPVPFREESLWDGYPEETNAPYGIAKKLLLAQGQAYRQEYGFNSVYLLPTNLYGPHDNFDLNTSHVIPAMFRKFVEAQEGQSSEVVLWGDGSPTREFLYVEDAAEGIALAAERYDGAEPVNLGSGYEISIRDLAIQIGNIVGFTGNVVWDTEKPNGQPRRCLDTHRAKEFGFSAATNLASGLQKTWEWYKVNRPEHALTNSPG